LKDKKKKTNVNSLKPFFV